MVETQLQPLQVATFANLATGWNYVLNKRKLATISLSGSYTNGYAIIILDVLSRYLLEIWNNGKRLGNELPAVPDNK